MRPLQRPEFHAFLIRCRLCAIVISFLFIHSNIFAQKHTETLFIDSYTSESGLRQSMVSQILQDSRGLLWMVTGDGLHCFDGREFRVFRIPYNGIYSNADNMMRKIIETEPGIFVISTASSFLRFDVFAGKFDLISRKPSVYHHLLDVLIGNKPLVWVYNKGLSVAGDSLQSLILNPVGRTIPEDFVPVQALPWGRDSFVVMGNHGILIAGTSGNASLYTCNYKWIDAEGCTAMATDRTGNIYIAKGTSLCLLREDSALVSIADLGMRINQDLKIDHQGRFWFSDIATKQHYRLSGNKLAAVEFVEIAGKYYDTIKPSVKHIFEDKMHNLWFGTDGNGLLRYNPDKVIFGKYALGFTRCLEALNGQIFAGTFNKGLWKLSDDLSRAERVNPALFGNNAYILDLKSDDKGRLWVATRNGLYVINSDGRCVFTYPANPTTASFLDPAENMVLLQCDASLFRFRADPVPSLAGESISNSVNSLLYYAGKQWVGTPLGLFIKPHNTDKNMNIPYKNDSAVLQHEIYQLLPLKDEVWAATGNGISVFSVEGKLINPYSSLTSLTDEVIYAILPDNSGRVWFSGINGIGCITNDRQRIVRFTMRNNLQSLEFNHNAALKGPEGRIYFGGINGINGIDPSQVKTEKELPRIHLFNLYVSDTIFSKGIPPDGISLSLSRDAAHLHGSVYTSGYGDASDQGFSFLLEGYEKEWNTPAASPAFAYRNLPPGEYRLLVRYTDPFRTTGTPIPLLTVKVVPAFWQTLWFAALLTIAIIAITVFIVKKVQHFRYINRIKALEQEHAIEKERLRISKDMHDEVGASLTRISILSEIAKSRQQEPDKTQKVIEQISEIAGDVVDELSEIIWAMNPKNDSLDSFAAYIRRYASTYLEATETLVSYNFPDPVAPLPMSAELRRNLFLTVKEAIHNVAKHADAKNLTITLQTDQKKLIIIIRDDGKGFSEELLPGTGNGLGNMNRRMEDCGGTFRISSGKGNGTEIIMTVGL